MPRHKELYYKVMRGRKQYTNRITQNLDAYRAIRGLKAWILPTTHELKKRTLILSDWTSGKWSPSKREQVNALINQLIDEGFAIYADKSKQITPLSKDGAKTYKTDMKPRHPDMIMDRAFNQLNLTKDEVFILDDYWLHVLLNDCDGSLPRSIKVSDYLGIGQINFLGIGEKKRKKAIEILKQLSPPLSSIILDNFASDARAQSKELQEHVPNAVIETSYRQLTLLLSEFDDILQGHTLAEKGIELAPGHLNAIEECTLERINLKEGELEQLIKMIRELQKLTLSHCTIQSSNLKIPPERLTQLNEMSLLESTLTSDHFKSLLLSAPNIDTLLLSYCSMDGRLELPSESLQKLQIIRLRESTIAMESLHNLLAAATNLQLFELSAFTGIEGLLILPQDSFPKLEELILQTQNINIHSIEALLLAAPNLLKLNLVNWEQGNEHLALPSNSLQRLMKLNLEGTSITTESLRTLLLATNELKDLNLSHCCAVDYSMGIPHKILPQLEQLELSATPITTKQLQRLLVETRRLETIHISSCNNLNQNLAIEPGSLNSIELINAAKSTISLQSVESLLRASPKVTRLNLDSCTNLSGSLNLPSLSLAQLKVINLSKSTITCDNVYSLLAAAEHLERLNLSNCNQLQDDMVPLLDTLTHLQEINLCGSNISTDGLQQLLAAAGNLKKLDVSGCYNILGDLTLPKQIVTNIAELSLSLSSLAQTESLSQLMLCAVKLKNLELEDCDRIDEAFELVEGSLPGLNTLKFTSKVKMKATHLQTLLFAAGNIKELELRRCNGINGQITLPKDSLTQLGKISLPTSITAENIITLLAAANNLYFLDLSRCTLINDALIKDIKDKYPKLDLWPPRNLLTSSLEEKSADHNNSAEKKHNPMNMKGFKPQPKDSFKYKGQDKTKSQHMVIEKISQYLFLSNKNLEVIDEIQNGICTALTRYFVEMGCESVDELLNMALEWDGTKEHIKKKLSEHFDKLLTYIQTYHLNNEKTKVHYLGDNLIPYLAQIKTPAFLSNPWHAIAVIPKANDSWVVYDPNFTNGSKTVHSIDALKTTIEHAIGRLISVDTQVPIPSRIEDPQSFIKEGGLLSLCHSLNAGEILKQSIGLDYSLEALEGLLLRSTNGYPAWAIGLSHADHNIARFSIHLVQQFVTKNPKSREALQNSMEVMPKELRITCIALLNQYVPSLASELSCLINTTVKEYEQRLHTWNKLPTKKESLKSYSMHCMAAGDIKKRLIKLNSSTEVQGMRFALEQQAKDINRPLVYVHSPEDLVCNAPFIQREGNKGLIQKGELGGGALYDFLEAHKDKAPIVIINYDSFDADNIVRLNRLLDKKRLIDKTELPKKALVIGLINKNKPDCYQGADFYGRFDVQETCPVSKDEIKSALPSLPFIENTRNPQNAIKLFHSAQWKDMLLGRWVPNGDSMRFEEGDLIAALRKNEPIEIQNGLWELDDFVLFWQEALLRRTIEHAGRIIHIPNNLKLIKHEGYAWADRALHLNVTTKDNSEHPNPLEQKPGHILALSSKKGAKNEVLCELILNPSCFNDFFNHLSYDNTTKSFNSQPGLIEANQGKSLNVYLTRGLSEDEWAMLLTECKRYQVFLNVSIAPKVTLPKELGVGWALAQQVPSNNHPVGPRPNLLQWNSKKHFNTQVISSTDIDVTVTLLNKHQSYQVIDISECTASDLIERLDGEFNQQTLRFEFQHTICALLNELNQGKRIILKGNFNPELADQLASLLLERQKKGTTVPGELILVSNETERFNYLPKNVCVHKVTSKEKRLCLGDLTTKLENKLMRTIHEPLSTLKARHVYWASNSLNNSSDNAWLGLHDLPNAILPLEPFDSKTSTATALAFKQQRRQRVNEKLLHTPYVFLAGLSGVGKSTFVNKELCRGKDTLYQNDKIKGWLEDISEGRKLLFIDEATLDSSDWTMFEGLFQDPPSILYKGQLYPLTKKHSVIFAGNPVNYGDERKCATLFERHGNTLVFDPLPTAVLYEDVLKPVFANTPLEIHQEALAAHFLEIYRFLVSCSKKDVLISPRELHMMALLTVSYCRNNPGASPRAAAEHFGCMIAKNLIPNGFQEQFAQQFKPLPLERPKEFIKNKEFLVTASRLPIYHHLHDVLALRKDRVINAAHGNDEQLYGGLGGIILESAPGLGKTELLMHALTTSGYEEMHDFERPATSLHPFYRLPVSLGQDQKEALLRKAFNEGAVVLIDEINSSPMMERLVNELLSGTMNGNKPENPGFLILASQNPVTLAGRHKQSTAVSRRFGSYQLEAYSYEEQLKILMSKGLIEEESKTLITAFNTTLVTARLNHWDPEPTFRDVIRIAEQEVEGENRKDSIVDNQPMDLYFEEKPLELNPSNGFYHKKLWNSFFELKENKAYEVNQRPSI